MKTTFSETQIMKTAFSGTPMQVPVLARVDVFVYGATSGAVAAALACREAGGSAYVVSDRSYFGEESAGALELWQKTDSGGPLARATLDPGEQAAPYPRLVKHRLERELLQARVPFLFFARPVSLLRDAAGKPAGVLVAFRTALYAIVASQIVDASRHGALARMAGPRLESNRSPVASAGLVALARELPESLADQGREIGDPFSLPARDGSDRIRAFRFDLGLDGDDAWLPALAGREHRLRAQLLDRELLYSADTILAPGTESIPGPHRTDPSDLQDHEFLAAPGVRVLNDLLPLDHAGLRRLYTAVEQEIVGRRIGALAASDARTAEAGPPADAVSGEGQAAGPFGFATAFVRDGRETLKVSFPALPHLGEFDVAVAGGGTGGAPAGISAARAGARTVVLEMQHGLGGVGTLGLIASYYFGNRVGFTGEIDDALRFLDPDRPESQSQRWIPELKMGWYGRALLEAGGTAWFGSYAFGVKMDGDRVAGLLVSTPFGAGYIGCGCVVDATGNADIAAAAGAPCRVIDSRHVAVQGTGLSPRKPGADYRNSDHTFIDDTDPVGVTHAFVNARAKFSDEFDVSPLVDSRERRQIVGEIELSPLDFLAGRTFPDTITTAMSNFDTHGFTVHPVFMVVPPDKKPLHAHVPFRCLLPKGVDGLLVTGLGMSAHRDAIPVIRMQADVQNQGYAAGLAAAMSAVRRAPLREIDLHGLQEELCQKRILDPEVLTHEDSFPLEGDAVARAADAGPVDLFNTAVLFAHAEASVPLLLGQLEGATDPDQRENAALILGMMGREEAAEVLESTVRGRSWDEGWNFKGMGQFGMSMSRVDALVVALGKTGSARAVEPLVEKIAALGEDAALSHCRAVAIASASRPDPRLAQALADLLAKPGVQGHAHLDTFDVIERVGTDINETEPRNLSLRELHLARGLYLCGDSNGLGRKILETYARDLRGHYARHAAAVLAEPDPERIRCDTC